MPRTAILLILCCCHAVLALAQRDSLALVDSLPTVEIVGDKARWGAVGKNTLAIQPGEMLAAQSVAEVLARETNLYIKSYGLGSLATSSLRGAGAAHTAILWKGVNLQSSMNGTMDLSLLPAFFLDGLRVEMGGRSDVWGSGSMGGSLVLDSKIGLPSSNGPFSVRAGLALGSFGQNTQNVDIAVHLGKEKKHATRLRLLRQSADNDFRFKNIAQAGSPSTKQVNAATLQNALLHETCFDTKSGLWESWLWWQTSHRQLPPSMTEANSQALQDDGIFRAGIAWSKQVDRLAVKTQIAYLDESIYFENQSIKANNRAKTGVAEMTASLPFENGHKLHLGLHQTLAKADTDNYEQAHQRYETAFFADYQFDKGPWRASVGARQAKSGPYWPFVASLGIERALGAKHLLGAQFAKNYRLPTFNDLYWTGQGNPDLRPESGLGGELTYRYRKSERLNASLSVFSNHVQNWILWTPQANNVWRPSNINTVWARGVEFALQGNNLFPNKALSYRASYNYTASTSEKVASNAANSLGKQLLYTPLHTANLGLEFIFKKLTISYSHNIIGKTPIRTDNSVWLRAYDLASLRMRYPIAFKRNRLEVFFDVENIFNEQYQAIEWRAMPGAHFKAGVHWYNK
jgi:vitamin B12 transporter